MYNCTVFFVILVVVVGTPGMALSQAVSECEITLGAGESITIVKYGLEIGFYGILLDCRCPEGLLCFWEGDATVKIWAAQSPEERLDFELHTYRGFQWQAGYGNYRITLVEVAPYPSIYGEIDPGEYKIHLIIKDDLAPIETTTWSGIKALL